MIIKKTSYISPLELELAAQQVEIVSQKYQKNVISETDVQVALQSLQLVNESLQNHKFPQDQQMANGLNNLLSAINLVRSTLDDKTTQAKVGAFQTALFALIKEGRQIEENLKSQKWKLGQKVEGTSQSKGT
jgi:outer membrane protein TolC